MLDVAPTADEIREKVRKAGGREEVETYHGSCNGRS